MSYPGFEILFRSVKDQFKNVDDASLAVIHWNLISNGFKCCGTGETWPSPDQVRKFLFHLCLSMLDLGH